IVVTLLDATPISTVPETASEPPTTPREKVVLSVGDAEEAEIADAPFEEVDANAPREALFEDEEPAEEEDDEFSRRIKAVEVADVDLGRSLDPATLDAPREGAGAAGGGPHDPPDAGDA
ncbi:MAG: hypothetical protein HY718_04755, partial [Planctomycetes bacterium]|nr:hypothetical protein [Planctomycetota bacterium]